eukprot:TRINITY_DN5959_c0_g1_i1.p2 TRINITY_DN5959_c0_g1~~TRINITY_DN5959_c0_g1_i1.p2  ORF type:complete len:242 (+),score=70.95 TRINITY_DN5959_c0_g1_i1:96-821(+)
MASLRERRHFAYELPSLVESHGDMDLNWTPVCKRTPLGNVALLTAGKASSAARDVLHLSELQNETTPWESRECIPVTEADLRRCGSDVSLLRLCAERREKQESCTPFPTPSCGVKARAAAAAQKFPWIGKTGRSAELDEAFAEEFRQELMSKMNEVLLSAEEQKRNKKLGYRLPGVQTMLKQMDDDGTLPPKLPPKRYYATPSLRTQSRPASRSRLCKADKDNGRDNRSAAEKPSALPQLH